jgi:uroporphyrinogen decarboxylase
MASMTHRQRVNTALNLEQPDRVPIDFGTIASSIDNKAYQRFVKHIGLLSELERPDLHDPVNPSTSVTPGPKVLEMYGVDIRSISADQQVDAQALNKVQLDDYTYRDEWGVIHERPRNEDGPYMIMHGPLQRDGLTIKDIEDYPWPDPAAGGRFTDLREKARKMHEETDYAIAVGVGHSSVSPCQRLRGFAQHMEDLALQPELAECLIEHVTQTICGSAEAILKECGEYVDIVSFADDLGLQDRAYFREPMFQKQIKPYMRRFVDTIHANTKAKAVMHTDGAVYALIPDLIDIGVDAINPVQTTAAGMEPERLKREFGKDLGFWGAVDTQNTLPFGTPEEVRADVRHKIDTLGKGGGYVITSCHNIREEVPAENVQALYETALEYGRYD